MKEESIITLTAGSGRESDRCWRGRIQEEVSNLFGRLHRRGQEL
jgi:hypothetical protein